MNEIIYEIRGKICGIFPHKLNKLIKSGESAFSFVSIWPGLGTNKVTFSKHFPFLKENTKVLCDNYFCS